MKRPIHRHICILILIFALALVLPLSYASAAKVKAEDADKFTVLNRGGFAIKIDANLDEWKLDDEILVMGEKTWEANGGSRKNDDDLTGELKILFDEDNLYFGFLVKDDEYVAKAATPWENDGVQMAIDSSAGKLPAGWPNGTTHLYNFSINDGWLKELGPFLGDAEIEMKRDEAAKQTIFEWRMPTSIIAKKGTTLKAGMEIAFAIIVNDSDKDFPGQAGWVGWGNHTIVFGKKAEEMKTLVLSSKAMPVEANGKLATTWGDIK